MTDESEPPTTSLLSRCRTEVVEDCAYCCPFSSDDRGIDPYCTLDAASTLIPPGLDGPPDWCPLREMPVVVMLKGEE